MTPRFLPLLLASLLLPACAGATRDDAGATYVIVRHAEKASDTERDPDLSAAGRERARQLARQFANAGLVAVYTTDYRRTRQTVEPSAADHGILPTRYDPALPAAEFAARLRHVHPHGTVLVAGHSNTVPDIVAALCACNVEPMPDAEYDRLSTIRIAPDGSATLEIARYGVHAP